VPTLQASPSARLSLADSALAAAYDRPTEVLEQANSLLQSRDDDEPAAVALRARALARRCTGDLTGAILDLTQAVKVAEAASLPRRVGEARMSLVVALADAGRTADALEEAERARPLLKGADLSRLLAQRALVLQRIGRYEDALACYRQSLPGLRKDGDSLWEARLLGNRGPMRAYLGDHRGAVNDLKRCAAVAEANGLWNQLARAWQNLGFAMSLVGDVPAALELLDNAAEVGQQRGFDDSSLVLDRAEALLAAGLGSEAADWASTALLGLDERGLAYDAAEARLLFARAALSAGRPQDARSAAEQAASEFAQQRRPAWTRLARQVSVLARWDAGERGAALTRAARTTADDCAAAGWTVASLSARFVAARSALESSSLTTARALLADVAVARGSGSAEARATGWHAEALLRLANKDRRGAERALRRALAVRADNAAALGATDLRAHAAVFGEELASAGLQLAVEDQRPSGVLAWAERSRASALQSRPARPPSDAALATELGLLRAVTAHLREELLAGRPGTELRQQQLKLESAVRARARHARGSSASLRSSDTFDVKSLAAQLGDRVMVELVRNGNDLHAVTVASGRIAMHDLCRYDEATTETTALRFALTRLAHSTGSPRVRELAVRGREVAAARLDTLLLTPLRTLLRDRPLVVVPTGDLHALPWPVLPSLVGRSTVVAPSARLWQRASHGERRSGRVALVAGPHLDHAEAEIAALAGAYPEADVLTGASATAEAVSKTIDGASLAHLATHGHFRSDNPQFSALELADGPLTVYDLERLSEPPETVVLSACDSGLSEVKPGDELMGLAAAVMALGTRTLVASAVPVADEPTRPFMQAFHARLVAGVGAAEALAVTSAETGLDGFVCLGSG
jgi:tetratricopeptide (TPR) repeat protein